MPVDQSVRQQLRERFNLRCGYCGVREVDHASELEIDHFQPRSKGGSNELTNLIYACTACNRAKGSYWPSESAPPSRYLLHPLQDSLTEHIELTENDLLQGLTERGRFHIHWLQLNRKQLIQYRQEQRERRNVSIILQRLLDQQARLQKQAAASQVEIERLYVVIERLRRSLK